MADTIQAPTKLYFEIQQGATFARTLTWRTGDPLAAVDLSTGYAARMTFLFGGASQTVAALASARQEPVSRATELGLERVEPGHVMEARRG